MILLDTHTLVWTIQGDSRLGRQARQRIEDGRNDSGVIVSVTSVWEIGQLAGRNRIELSLDYDSWIAFVKSLPGYGFIAIDADVAQTASRLKWAHRDPADRFIVATALQHDHIVLTADEKILAYAAAGHVQAIDARV